jgi:hypothetical protein
MRSVGDIAAAEAQHSHCIQVLSQIISPA